MFILVYKSGGEIIRSVFASYPEAVLEATILGLSFFKIVEL